jgi:ABC-type uncharacterized transport system permease subunit
LNAVVATLLLQFAAIVLQLFGTLFVWYDTERISYQIQSSRVTITDDAKWKKWRYNKSWLGFSLLLAGIILLGVSLVLTMNEYR